MPKYSDHSIILRPTESALRNFAGPPSGADTLAPMAKGTPSKAADDAGQIRLRWPRSRIQLELDRQIDEGARVAESLSTPDSRLRYDELRPLSERWHARNRTVMEQAFTRSMARDYEPLVLGRISSAYDRPPTLEEKIAKTAMTLNGRIQRLMSIRDRIDLFDEEYSEPTPVGDHVDQRGQRVFIVHGRATDAKHELARTIEQITGNAPTILHEQPDGGRTIIEKFEDYASEAGAAVVLLTPDDEGRLKSGSLPSDLADRARQNVVYELGWFHGRLGRGKVIALLGEGVEKPSDLDGVLYLPLDPSGSWKLRLGHELRAADIEADLNNLSL
ncbi:MAG: hypothetical protein QOH36_1722 [Actinomycetota bacterium]|nr:hypothetical protein [Actinomycetota bacterium]